MNDMKQGPFSADEAGRRKEVEDARVLLTSVRSTLADQLREVSEGNAGALKEVVLKQAELESALKKVFEAEQRYHDWHSKHSGRGEPGDIDFDAIRHDIACRLARLRECCREG